MASWETRRGFQRRLAYTKLDVMEQTSHLSKVRPLVHSAPRACGLTQAPRLQADLLNVWKIFHMYHLDARGTQRQQAEYLAGKQSVRLSREQYESILGLEQNRYRYPPHSPQTLWARWNFLPRCCAGMSSAACSTVRPPPSHARLPAERRAS